MEDLIKPQNLTISTEQLSVLLPYFIVCFGAMITLLLGVSKTLQKNQAVVLSFSLVTILAALYSIVSVWGEPSVAAFNQMMVVDYYSNLFNVIILVVTALVLLGSYSYLEKQQIHHFEYYSLTLFSALGMMLLVSALDLIVLFLALETMSIGVYVLVGFRRADTRSNEAGLKYFVLGSAASAVMLFGMALLYGTTASLNLTQISSVISAANFGATPLFVLGAVLVLAGFLFKVAMAPFHMWMPDVYEGAPTTVTNFMTSGLKAAAFAAFLRFFMAMNKDSAASAALVNQSIHNILWVIAVLTMFLGNVIALTQRNLKRMLAYSSIAHSGYILVGFLAGSKSDYGYSAVVLYLASYAIMNLGAFTLIALFSEKNDRCNDVQDLAGLGFKHPILGFAMAVFMFSMAGVPPTIGFAGKYMLFSAAVQAGEINLVILGVLCSAISAYYYLRVIVYMYMKEPLRDLSTLVVNWPARIVLIVATLATIHLGVFPTLLINAAKKAIHL